MRLMPVSTVLGLTFLLAASSANAQVIQRTKLADSGVLAQWEYTEANVTTVVLVSAFRSTTKTPGEGSTIDPILVVNIIRSNDITADLLLLASGYTGNFSLNVDGSLQQAQVSASEILMADDASATVFPVDLNLTFVGTGAVVKDRYQSVDFDEEGLRTKLSFKATSRPASASGTVTGLGTNFTPTPSDTASINKSVAGTLITETGPRN